MTAARINRNAAAAIWPQYLAERSLELRNRLAELYRPLVLFAARRLARRTGYAVEADDLVGPGDVALLRQIPRYDAGRGVPPEAFLLPRIRGAMVDYLRAVDPTPRSVRSGSAKVAELRESLGHEPSVEQIVAAVGCSPKNASDYRRPRGWASLERTVPLEGGREATLGNLLESREGVGDPLREEIDDRLAVVSPRARRLIVLYYLDGLPMREIAGRLGMSESRVSQLHGETLRRLYWLGSRRRLAE